MPIVYETEDLTLTNLAQKSLLEICIKNKIPIDHVCDGMATCGTCRVILTKNADKMPSRNEMEKDMAKDRGFAANERLACQLITDEDFSFVLPTD